MKLFGTIALALTLALTHAEEAQPKEARLLFQRTFREDFVVVNRNLTVELTLLNTGTETYEISCIAKTLISATPREHVWM